MKQLFDHYDEYGNPVDIHGNVITDGIAQPGQGIRVPLTMMDSMQRVIAQEHQMDDKAPTVTIKMTPSAIRAALRKHLPGWTLSRGGEGPEAERAGKKAEAEASRDAAYLDGLQDAEQDALREQERILTESYRDSAPRTGDAAAEYEAKLANSWQ